MTYAKTTVFTDQQQQLARLAKALGHPARVAIIELLASRTTCISGDIAAELPLARTTVTQHLQELKAAGLVRGEVAGLTVCYCLDVRAMQQAQALLGGLFAQAAANPACGPDDACGC